MPGFHPSRLGRYAIQSALGSGMMGVVYKAWDPLSGRPVALKILRQELHHAHGHGTIHRDIKPSNIMVLPGGEPKILDFGIALAAAGQLTAADESWGTPAYMSPEDPASPGQAEPQAGAQVEVLRRKPRLRTPPPLSDRLQELRPPAAGAL